MKRMIIVMGVAGCGKTTVGERLAQATGFQYIDGDQLHPQANIEKMSSGDALTDDDRWPWLEAIGETLAQANGSIIIGCSALKRSYRDVIRNRAGGPVSFLHLSGSRQLIGERMNYRTGHFMPPSLLDSQFAALEPPTADEEAVTIDIARPLDDTIAELARQFKGV